MGIGIDWDHVRLWRRRLLGWAAFVAFLVVAGWGLGPRPDEVLFVLVVVPLAVLIPYVAGCLGLALLRLWLVGEKHGRPGRVAGIFHVTYGRPRGGAGDPQAGAQDVGRPRLR